MRKLSKYITFFAAIAIIFHSNYAVAKNTNYQPPGFFRFVISGNKKSENPKLKEKLEKIKRENLKSKKPETENRFKKYNLEDNERNVFESCFAWLAIIVISLVIIKIICGNFKIPFDYDPNFKNKYTTHRRVKNKKYNFQKR